MDPVLVKARKQTPSIAGMVLIAPLAVFATVLLIASLGWEYTRDTPLLNYVGFVIQAHDFAPYRDIFETSMPGTLAFHSLLAGAGLTSDPGFMALAAGIVLGFSLLGALAILPFGLSGSLVAVPLLVSAMLLQGPGWILKIDMVALLPISAALCLAVFCTPGRVMTRQALIGLLFGIAGTMKPHLAFGAPVVVLTAFWMACPEGTLRRAAFRKLPVQIAVALAGFAVPMLLAAAWLVSTGAYGSFVMVLTEYLPLHLEKTDWQEFVTPEEKRRIARAATLRLGGHYLLVPAAGLSVLLALWARHRLTRQHWGVLAALCLLNAIYGLAPALGGQFYVYYYFPFFFFSLLLIALTLPLLDIAGLRPPVATGLVLCLGGFLLVFGSRFYSPLSLLQPGRLEQVQRMEEALDRWVPEHGRVQPIDWTSGVVHAMLRREVLPATPYLYDYHFHHHVGSEINTRLRDAFMAALEADPPEVFMQARVFPRVSGLNTSETFPARDAFLADRYRVVQQDPDFVVYLRRDLAQP